MANPILLSPGRYRLTTDAPRDPVTGRRNQRTKVFRGTLTEARHAQAAWETFHRGVDHTGTSATFASLLDRWLDHHQHHVEATTWDAHRRRARDYLIPHLGDIPLRDLTTSHFDEMYVKLTTTMSKRGRAPLSAGSIAKVHDTACCALDQAVRWDWIQKNPASLARKPPNHRREPITPNTAELGGYLEWLKMQHPDHYTFVNVLAGLGCRPGELCAVRLFEVDFGNASITLSGSIRRDVLRSRKATKTHKVRSVALDAATVRLLEKHVAGAGLVERSGYLFHEHGDPMVPWRQDLVSIRLGRWRKAAEVGQDITLRSLRHYCATTLIGAGVDPRTVAGRLGHSNPAMTLTIYSAFLPENDRAAAELLAAIRGEK